VRPYNKTIIIKQKGNKTMFTEILNEEQLNNEEGQARCDDILRYGKIVKDEESVHNGHHVRDMVIVSDEQNTYFLKKVDGQWVVLRRFFEF
jgi:polyhydroxyalkanoate synthesis regulator phasin